jgi:hypothetical protein
MGKRKRVYLLNSMTNISHEIFYVNDRRETFTRREKKQHYATKNSFSFCCAQFSVITHNKESDFKALQEKRVLLFLSFTFFIVSPLFPAFLSLSLTHSFLIAKR